MATSSYWHLVAQAREIGLAKFALDPTSNVHGAPHWDRVAENARLLVSRMETGANLAITTWFAYLHDCMRLNDAEDPEHGQRAVGVAAELYQSGAMRLTIEEFGLLCTALADHSKGFTTGPLIVRICWDADRLDLPRCHCQPTPSRMATTVGRQMAQNMLDRVRKQNALVTPQFGRTRP